MPLIRVGTSARAAAAGYVERFADRLATRAGVASGRRSPGFNCCESCGEPLRRHPEHTWRYEGRCAECGFVQSWAGASDRPHAFGV